MTAFWDACGASAPIRLEVRRDGAVSEAAFDSPAVIVGRDGRADLTIIDDEVASRHLYLQVIRGRLFAVHLADRTSTYCSGRRWIAGWVYPGHEFEIGNVVIRVLGPEPPPDSHLLAGDNPLVPNRAQAPYYSFEPLTSRSKHPRRFYYRQELLLIGRIPPCRLVIRHPDVSRCHAAVLRTRAGTWIVDLLSRTGVSVNGVPVAISELKPDDRIEFGRIGVRVCGLESPPSAGEPPVGALVPDAESLAPLGNAADPILDQVAALQQQTFEQFQDLLGTMMQMVGGILNEQRQFVREELERLERLVVVPPAPPALPPASTPTVEDMVLTPAPDPVAPPTPPPQTPRPRAPQPQSSMDEVQLHAWLEQQLGSMNRQQSAAWDRLVRMLRGG